MWNGFIAIHNQSSVRVCVFAMWKSINKRDAITQNEKWELIWYRKESEISGIASHRVHVLHIWPILLSNLLPCKHIFLSISVQALSLSISPSCVFQAYLQHFVFDSLPTPFYLFFVQTDMTTVCTWMTCHGVNPLQNLWLLLNNIQFIYLFIFCTSIAEFL